MKGIAKQEAGFKFGKFRTQLLRHCGSVSVDGRGYRLVLLRTDEGLQYYALRLYNRSGHFIKQMLFEPHVIGGLRAILEAEERGQIMDLETAKLVAFALWAESFEGVTGKGPAEIYTRFNVTQAAVSLEALRDWLGDELGFKLDNYLTVWEAETEADKAFDELESAAAEEQKETPAEEAQEITKADIGKVEDFLLTPAEELPFPKKQRGKRAR